MLRTLLPRAPIDTVDGSRTPGATNPDSYAAITACVRAMAALGGSLYVTAGGGLTGDGVVLRVADPVIGDADAA